MRIILFMLVVVLNSFPMAFSAEAQCQCVCRYGPYGKECRRVCAERRYVPAPQYTPRNDSVPSVQYAGPQINPGAILPLALAALVAVLAAVAIAAGVGGSALNKEIEKIDASTAAFDAQGDHYARRTRAIHRRIAREERRAFEEGRADADREWHLNRKRES